MRMMVGLLPRHSWFGRFASTLATTNLNYAIDTNLRYDHQIDDRHSASQSIVSCNRKIYDLLQNSQIIEAQNLFDEMPQKDIVSYNTILSGLNKAKDLHEVYRVFLEMERAGIKPNEYTISIMLTTVLNTVYKLLVPQIHARIVCLALNVSVFVGSALIQAYANVGDRAGLSKAFEEILNKDVTSWNAFVSGYMELGCMKEARKSFHTMPHKDVVSWTALVKGYIRNKWINKALSVFNKMSEKNVISWTAMISGYVRSERFVDAMRLFLLMVKSGTTPNKLKYSSVLDACAGCSSLRLGQQVHSSIMKSSIPHDVVLSTSLVDMYAKCGEIEAAFCVFESMQRKNLASWSSMIGGYARNRFRRRALELFEGMIKIGVQPDQVTFFFVLSACGHEGSVICSLNSNLGEFAAEGISQLKKDHPGVYSMVLKIHGKNGIWNTVVKLRKMMKEKRVSNQKAGNGVESPLG